MKKTLNNLLKNSGFQIIRYPDKILTKRIQMVKYFDIDVLFDIGANTGQYAMLMREIGYPNKIISFEPLSSAFNTLKKNSLKDKQWIVANYAIGEENKKSVINVSGNSHSSSILNMYDKHSDNAPNSKYADKEEISIKKLDSIIHNYIDNEQRIMLKIDTQGYEKRVLKGADQSLKNVDIIQMEMSLVPLYEDEMLFMDMIIYLEDKGYTLFHLENGFSSKKTGQLLQVDGFFVKSSLI